MESQGSGLFIFILIKSNSLNLQNSLNLLTPLNSLNSLNLLKFTESAGSARISGIFSTFNSAVRQRIPERKEECRYFERNSVIIAFMHCGGGGAGGRMEGKDPERAYSYRTGLCGRISARRPWRRRYTALDGRRGTACRFVFRVLLFSDDWGGGRQADVRAGRISGTDGLSVLYYCDDFIGSRSLFDDYAALP